MKNKLLTYILGAVVVGVWGMIIYRVIVATSGDSAEVVQVADNGMKKVPFDDYSVAKDTTRLILNYRDPFGIQKRDTAEISINKTTHKSPVPINQQKQVQNWNFIKYGGFIRKTGSKKLLAIVSINNKEAMMSEGETVDHVKLLKNLKDSIKVAYQGNTTVINMNNNKAQ